MVIVSVVDVVIVVEVVYSADCYVNFEQNAGPQLFVDPLDRMHDIDGR